MIEFLKALRRTIGQKLLIVWDRLQAHRSKIPLRYVEAERGAIMLEYLPAYAPELNPVEYIWGYLKRDAELLRGKPHGSRRSRTRPAALDATPADTHLRLLAAGGAVLIVSLTYGSLNSNAAQVLPPHIGTAREVIIRKAGTLTTLVDDLLDWEQALHGKLRLHMDHIDLAETAREVLAQVKSGARAANCTIELLAEHAVWVIADRTRIEQVITNLLHNALRHAGAKGTIEVTVHSIDGSPRLTVSDTGSGIPEDLLPRIFEPFMQGPGAYGRLGVGLALVKRIMELNGGNVTASSAGPGRGSTFELQFSAARAAGRS